MNKISSLFNQWIAADNPSDRNSLAAARETILRASLVIAVVFGALVLLANVPPILRQQNWALLVIYSTFLVLITAVTFVPRLPYHLRAASLLAVIYGIGLLALFSFGLSGNGRAWLVAFCVMASVLLGLRPSILAIVVAVFGWAMMGILMVQGAIPVPALSDMANSGDASSWVAGGVTVMGLGTLASLSIGVLLRRLESSLRQERQLYDRLEVERTLLEKRVQQRTADLERRVIQIRTAAEISRALGSLLDPDQLFKQVTELIRERFDLYYVGVFLVSGNQAVLRAGTGSAGELMLSLRHQLQIGGASMIGWTIANRKPRIALDVGEEAVRFNNPYLPLTRSELALPLLSGDQVFGAISIQSTEPRAFDENDIVVLQGIADSLATALENARLFEKAQASLEEVRSLHKEYLGKAWLDFTQAHGRAVYEHQSDQNENQTAGIHTIDVPIELRDQVIGRIALDLDKASLSPEEQDLVETITNETAIAIESSRLLEETQRRAEREKLLAEISQKVRDASDVELVLRTAVSELGKSFQAAEAIIQIDPGGPHDEP